MWPIAVVWLAAIVIGGLLWSRFTRPPSTPTVPVPPVPPAEGGPAAPPGPRRVVPLWLVLALMMLLVGALWFTLQWGSARAGG